MKPARDHLRMELRLAKHRWPHLPETRMKELQMLIQRYRISVRFWPRNVSRQSLVRHALRPSPNCTFVVGAAESGPCCKKGSPIPLRAGGSSKPPSTNPVAHVALLAMATLIPPTFLLGPRRRDARCRNSRRQPRSAESVWNRPLLRRGTRMVFCAATALSSRESRTDTMLQTARTTANPGSAINSAF